MWVTLVDLPWIRNDLKRKRDYYYGIYNDDTKTVFVDKDLNFDVKRHALYHELAHHILYTLEQMGDEEDKCDVLGRYLMELVDSGKETDKGLRLSGKKD